MPQERKQVSVSMTLRTVVSAIAMFAFVTAGLVFSQTFDESNPARTFAVLIGVSNYVDTRIPSLRYAAADAKAVGDFLLSPRGGAIPPDNVVRLLEAEASKDAIATRLGFLGENLTAQDVVYVFIAGHGDLSKSGLAYFVPANADPTNLYATGTNFKELKDLIEENYKKAKFRVLLMDVCHAGRMEDGSRNTVNQLLNSIRPAGPFLNLLASRGQESSFESEELGQGFFTYALLDALNGKAGSNIGLVNAKTVVDYVEKEVPSLTSMQQHPTSNSDFDENRILAWTDRPGPVRTPPVQASLVILNTDRTAFDSVEWFDTRYRARSIRKLPKANKPVELFGLPTGQLEFKFSEPNQPARKLILPLETGQNKLDILNANLARYRFESAGPVQVAALGVPTLPAQALPTVPPEEAILSLRLEAGTTVLVDDTPFATSTGTNEFIQLNGLATGIHNLTLVASATRESRFRLRLFAGTQIFEPETGELRYVVALDQDPASVVLPQGLPANLAPVYRNFVQALWEERLLQPQANSAWDFYSQMRNAVPVPLRDQLTQRLIIAMGNRAQRIILRYLRGGDIRWNAGTFDEGALLTDRMQQLFQFNPTARQDIQSRQSFFTGRALVERGQYAQAVQELQRSTTIFPQASYSYNAIGLAYWKQSSLQQAIAPLQQAIGLSPLWTYPRNILALVQLELRQYNNAEQTFQQSLLANAEDSTSHHGLAQLYLLEGRVADAEARVRQAVEFNPGNAYAYQTYGRLEERRNNLDEAERLFRLAIRLEPDEVSFRVSLAELLKKRGRVPEAQQMFGQLGATNPTDAGFVKAYAAFLTSQNGASQAASVYEKAIKLASKDARLRVYYGEFLNDQKRGKDAEKQYQEAIKLAPSNAIAHQDLANLYRSQGKIVQAERELAAARKADPLLPNAPMSLGQIRVGQGRYAEAIAAYTEALTLFVEPDQKEELQQLLKETRTAAAKDAIQTAQSEIEKNRLKNAWSAYVSGLRSAPEDRGLIEALLKFESDYPSNADVSMLPMGGLASALQTSFWADLRQAETLWKQDKPEDGIRTFARALDGMSAADRRKITSTAFNIRNENYGIHQIVYRWATRLIERKDFPGAQKLMDAAIRQKIFDHLPGARVATIDSLMTPVDGPEPKSFGEFQVIHTADRRAHEIFAVIYAGQGDTAKSDEMLQALEPDQRTAVISVIKRIVGSN